MKVITVRRDGFTLAEVLITIAIVAVLAAVLLPVLTGQLRKGDIARVTSDITSVRTGMEAFLADMKRVPGEVDHLLATPSTTDEDAAGDTYSSGLLNRWRGPYLDKAQDGSFEIASGFGGKIVNDLSTDSVEYNSALWAVVRIDGLTNSEFEDIDLAIDEEISSSTGRFRFNASSTALYFAVPIN